MAGYLPVGIDDGGSRLERELADLIARHTEVALDDAERPTRVPLDAKSAHLSRPPAPVPASPAPAAPYPAATLPASPAPAAIDALLAHGPGPALAAALASAEPADLDDTALVELLAAWERLSAWAQSGSALALGELLHRTRGSSRHEFVVDEVSARLGLSRHAAAQHVAVAHGASVLPEVADAMAAGVVDRRKAEVLVTTGRLEDERRREVVRDLRPDIEHLTVRQLRDRLRRAEIADDPAGAGERHERARRTRSVVLEPVDDAMAYLTAYLPAGDAARAFAAIDGAGTAMRRTAGEERRLDECRADALVGLLTGAIAEPGAGSDTSPAVAPGRASAPAPALAPARVPVQVTIGASTLLGTDDLPAILAGYGPIPAPMARTIATDPDATWQRILTDPGSGVLVDRSSRSYRPSAALRAAVVARDATCTFPGCGVPAARGDLDHIVPFDAAHDGPQTVGDNLHALCRTHHRAKTTGGWAVARDPGTGVTTWKPPTRHQYRVSPHVADPSWDPAQQRRPRPGSGIDDGVGPPPDAGRGGTPPF